MHQLKLILIVFGLVLFYLLNSCTRGDDCSTVGSKCNDSTVAKFVLSTEARNWWINDSIKSNEVLFKNVSGARLSLDKTYYKSSDKKLAFSSYKVDYNGCLDPYGCPIQVKYEGYEMNYYNSVYNFNINVELKRKIPANTSDLNRSNWSEYLEFSNNGKYITLIPGRIDNRFNKNEIIDSITINNKMYTKVYHVYDSSIINKNTIQIMGYLFTPKKGIIQYYLNNNEVWTLQ